MGALACRIHRVVSSSRAGVGFEGIVNGEHERSVGASDGSHNLPRNSADATRSHRDSDSRSGHERDGKIRRSRAHDDGECARLLDFARDAAESRPANFADPPKNRGRAALQGCVYQRTKPRPRRRGIGIHGAVTAVLEDRISTGRLGIVDRTQAHDWSGGRKTPSAGGGAFGPQCSGNVRYADEESLKSFLPAPASLSVGCTSTGILCRHLGSQISMNLVARFTPAFSRTKALRRETALWELPWTWGTPRSSRCCAGSHPIRRKCCSGIGQ
jgi:hypothetical protein